MSNSVTLDNDTIELDGKTFVPAEQVPIPEWPCMEARRLQPTLTLKDNDLFLITNTVGNISESAGDDFDTSLGLFCQDTRFLSRLELQIEGHAPTLLSNNAGQGFALSVLCANPYIKGGIPAETIGIQRNIALQGGLFEELIVTNYNTQAVSCEISLSFDADFVDLFQIRGFARYYQGTLMRQVQKESNDHESWHIPSTVKETEELILAYRGLDKILRESRIQFYQRPPDRLEGYTALWQLFLAPHETQIIGYRLQAIADNRSASVNPTPINLSQAIALEEREENQWRETISRIRTNNSELNQIIERAEQDIYLLNQTFDREKVLVAGVPWFSALFGRDSIIAAQQTLIFDPDIARQTLILLARYQGKVEDESREEEPGKILHELRLGEMANCGEIPHTPYYGTADATALWLILYADYYAWTGDRKTCEKLWKNAIAAMDWLDRSCRETGYIRYECKSPGGLRNQGWKDSDNCIVDAQGNLAVGAIALAEIQGYVYAAKMRLSELARQKKCMDLARRWHQEAQNLKIRFNRDFWLKDRGYIALALDGEGKPVDSITSNPGHCLGLDILFPEYAEKVAERLQAPDLFSGWGIRTLSSDSPAYNPMSYHIGSIWPHDNGMIAAGLRVMGRVDQSLGIARSILDMTAQQPYYRPPELFCGYDRLPKSKPVRYPVACTPQAWATGTIFQILQIMVNLVPDVPNNRLHIIHPVLPESIRRLSLENLRIGQTLLDLEFERAKGVTACRVVRKQGNLRIAIEA
ncbi:MULTISPECIES: amylo-alpha-1,6-glucosidase [Spirulina sp. CCY15215]|uniref:amylo-alpha-1,6-glucosidase n=1 Tax=Spirulina sp. CCY15215 TaxID=2767591 RepID=UPI001951B232|nr:amylo-alpha-1,6-glucosidase [Spirulina major]